MFKKFELFDISVKFHIFYCLASLIFTMVIASKRYFAAIANHGNPIHGKSKPFNMYLFSILLTSIIYLILAVVAIDKYFQLNDKTAGRFIISELPDLCLHLNSLLFIWIVLDKYLIIVF